MDFSYTAEQERIREAQQEIANITRDAANDMRSAQQDAQRAEFAGYLKLWAFFEEARDSVGEGGRVGLARGHSRLHWTDWLSYAYLAIGLFLMFGPVLWLVMSSFKTEAALTEFGSRLGTAFQLVDDAIDYVSDAGVMGKDAGDDFREGKMTLPVILALRAATAEERGFWARVIATLSRRWPPSWFSGPKFIVTLPGASRP